MAIASYCDLRSGDGPDSPPFRTRNCRPSVKPRSGWTAKRKQREREREGGREGERRREGEGERKTGGSGRRRRSAREQARAPRRRRVREDGRGEGRDGGRGGTVAWAVAGIEHGWRALETPTHTHTRARTHTQNRIWKVEGGLVGKAGWLVGCRGV